MGVQPLRVKFSLSARVAGIVRRVLVCASVPIEVIFQILPPTSTSARLAFRGSASVIGTNELIGPQHPVARYVVNRAGVGQVCGNRLA